MLKPSEAQQAALDQLLLEQQDPHSKNYHKWLSQDQYAHRFGLADDDLSAITEWLQQQGFRSIQVAHTRTFISFAGNAATVQNAFATEIHKVNYEGKTYFANVSAPSIPSALFGIVQAIAGLNDFPSRSMIKRSPEPGVLAQPAVSTNSFTPPELYAAYDLSPLQTADISGTGVTVVVVGQADPLFSDLTSFQSTFSLPQNSPTQVLVGTDPGAGSVDDQEEEDLDLEWLSAAAPGAAIVYDYATNALTQALPDAIDNKRGQIVSISFTDCESSPVISGTISSIRQTIQAGNAMGITVLAASGDAGAAACEPSTSTVATTGLAVNFPASAPEVTAVGGTEFESQLSASSGYVAETTWNDTVKNGRFFATGGGESTLFAQPSWQNVPGVPPGSGNRYVPDVALNASTSIDPYSVISGGQEISLGGTSAATPTWAGILAVVEQYLAQNAIATSPGLGNANPMLYQLSQMTSFPQPGTTIFHDITTGTNKVACEAGSTDCGSSFTIGFSAGPGYDETTGLGSVDANQLALWWGYLTGTPVPSLSPAPVSFPSLETNASEIQTAVLSNTGPGLLTISSIGFTGTNASEFTETDSCGTPKRVFPGDSCSIYVTFAPTVAGSATATLAVATNAPGSPASVTVTGTSTAPTAVMFIAPAALYFSDTAIGVTKGAQGVAITSGGSLPLKVSNVAVSGANASDFSQTNSCTAQVVNTSCFLSVTFSPSGAGLRTATVTVTGNTSQPQSFPISGFGVEPLILSQSSIAFNSQAIGQNSAANQVTLTNAGTSSIVVPALGVSGTNPSDYRVSSDCGSSLAAGAVCGITVWFTPANLGASSATITGTTSSEVNGASVLTTAFTVALSGNGVADSSGVISKGSPRISISPGITAEVAGGGTSTAENVPATSAALAPPNSDNGGGSGNLLIDSSNNLYIWVSDGIREISSATGYINTIAGNPNAANLTGDNGSALNAGIILNTVLGIGLPPTVMQFDNNGNIVFIDQATTSTATKPGLDDGWVTGSIRRINLSTGIITTVAGVIITSPVGATTWNTNVTSFNDGIAATAASLGIDQGLAVDSVGNIYVSDLASGRVRRIDAVTNVITTIAGERNTTSMPYTFPGENPTVGLLATDASLPGPTLAINPAGDLLIEGIAVNLTSGLIDNVGLPAPGGWTFFDANGNQYFNAVADSAGDIYTTNGDSVNLTSPNGAPMNFGSSGLGVASGAKTLTIAETGTGIFGLLISSIAVQGANAGDFAITSTGCSAVASGSNGCSISATFTPSGLGDRFATLVITDNAPGSPHTVPLTGSGVFIPPSPVTLSLSATSLTFTNVVVSSPGQPQTLTVTNSGTTTTDISINLAPTPPSNSTDDFTETNTCGPSLAAGAKCTISVNFVPDATGTYTAVLNINTDSSNARVALNGTAIAEQLISVSPASLAFSVKKEGAASTAQTVQVTNFGGATLEITRIAITGTNASDFVIESSTCGTTLAAGDDCSLALGFNPGQPGLKSASLYIADNAPGSPQLIPLLGTAGTPVVSFSSNSVGLGSSLVGSTATGQSVTVTNTGPVPLIFASVAIGGANASDFTETNTCTPSVAAGANCTIMVGFTPSAVGARTAAITLTDNAADSPETITLTGSGVAPAVTLAPTSLTFASQATGSTSAAQAITLTNSGNAALTIASISASGDFAETQTCGSSLAAGANCKISVTFIPTSVGSRNGAISITDNATGSPQTVSLSGTGATPPSTPTVKVTPASFSISTAQALSVMVAVSGASGSPTPTGSVTLTSGSYSSGAVTLTSGSASINVPGGLLAVGSDLLTANYSPDSNSSASYNTASGASGIVTVTQAAQTITFANPGTQTVGTPLTLSATASSGLAVTFTSTTTSICTVSGTTATFIASGTCTIDANQAGNSGYTAAAMVPQSFTVNNGTQTITFANPGAQNVGTPLTLAATASSALPVSFISTTTSVCTVSGTTATFIASGTCTIDANQAGNSVYTAAAMVPQTFTVNGEAQTITFANPGTQTVGTPLTLSATASSGLGVSFTSTITSICTVSGTTATFIASGTCTIDANQAGNTGYAAAAVVPQSFTVNPASTFTIDGGGSSSSISIVPGATTGNTATITVTPANGFTGTVSLTCSISPVAASDPATCSLSPSSVTITGTGAQTTTLTVFTTAATSAENRLKKLLWPSAGTALALLLIGLPRRRRNWPAMLGVLLLFVAIAEIGCGGAGSSGSGGGGSGGNAGTTPGSYTVTVTGTSGAITGTLGTVTFTVQ